MQNISCYHLSDPNFPELIHFAPDKVGVAIQTELQPQRGPSCPNAENKIPEFHHLPKDMQGICKSILLSICISANLGGTGTLTGTGPNLVFSGQLQQYSTKMKNVFKLITMSTVNFICRFFPNQTAITFASWLAFGIPTMVICLILAWFWLQIFFMGWK